MDEIARALWDRLAGAGHVAREYPPPDDEAPWYVAVALGLAAWFAAALVIGFMVAIGWALFEEEAGRAVVGAALCAFVAAMLRTPRSMFVTQLLVPLGLAGQVALITTMPGDLATAAAFGLVVGVAMTALVSLPLHRFLSAGVAFASLFVLLDRTRAWGLATVACVATAWVVFDLLRRRGTVRRYVTWRPVGYAAVAALPLAFAYEVATRPGVIPPDAVVMTSPIAYVESILLGALLVSTAAGCLAGHATRGNTRLAVYATVVLVALAGFVTPALVAALAIVLLGFAAAEVAVLAIGIATLLAALGLTYYDLSYTLLAKSALLAATGIVVGALAYAWDRASR